VRLESGWSLFGKIQGTVTERRLGEVFKWIATARRLSESPVVFRRYVVGDSVNTVQPVDPAGMDMYATLSDIS